MIVRSRVSEIVSCERFRPCGFELLRQQVPLRDRELLRLRVARELDRVHPVEQRPRDRVDRVRGADEEHLREVERQVEVVVPEVPVLLGVEHLEHRARRVAAVVGSHLVDLVDQDHRVPGLGVAQRADDRARQRADVRAPVAADLGLVPHAADRHADELAAERPRDRLPERRLADAGRPDEAEDLPRDLVAQLRHGQVLDDAVLDLLEVEVVLVEHAAGVLEVEVVLRRLLPGQAEDPFQIAADDAVLGGRCRQTLEPSQLPLGRFPDVLGELRLVEALAQLVQLRLLGVALAQLGLDRLQLLTQEVLALALLHLGLDLRLDLRAELEHLGLAREDRRDVTQPPLDVRLFEQLLALLGRDRAQRGRDQVGERARVIDVRHRELQLRRQVGREADDPRE